MGPSYRSVSLGNGSTKNSFEPVAGAPVAPTGLSAKCYSATTGELIWTRPTTAGLRYEVSRDGTGVKTITGVSYYDTSLPAATWDVAYGVVAIDAVGKRSPVGNIILKVNGSTAGTPTIATTPTPTLPATDDAMVAN